MSERQPKLDPTLSDKGILSVPVTQDHPLTGKPQLVKKTFELPTNPDGTPFIPLDVGDHVAALSDQPRPEYPRFSEEDVHRMYSESTGTGQLTGELTDEELQWISDYAREELGAARVTIAPPNTAMEDFAAIMADKGFAKRPEVRFTFPDNYERIYKNTPSQEDLDLSDEETNFLVRLERAREQKAWGNGKRFRSGLLRRLEHGPRTDLVNPSLSNSDRIRLINEERAKQKHAIQQGERYNDELLDQLIYGPRVLTETDRQRIMFEIEHRLPAATDEKEIVLLEGLFNKLLQESKSGKAHRLQTTVDGILEKRGEASGVQYELAPGSYVPLREALSEHTPEDTRAVSAHGVPISPSVRNGFEYKPLRSEKIFAAPGKLKKYLGRKIVESYVDFDAARIAASQTDRHRRTEDNEDSDEN